MKKFVINVRLKNGSREVYVEEAENIMSALKKQNYAIKKLGLEVISVSEVCVPKNSENEQNGKEV